MKKIIYILSAISLFNFIACKKDTKTQTVSDPVTSNSVQDNYTSLDDFYAKNGVPLQTFTINAGTGGSYVSVQGTTVNIPANTFTPASAAITIEFKDIYTKSDMLLSDKPTIYYTGRPLKSAGEFYIKALNNNIPLNISSGKKIEILQPTETKQAPDPDMKAMVLFKETVWKTAAWLKDSSSVQLSLNVSKYIYSLYNFSSPLSNGTWCNSDNSYYFSSFQQT